jgi:hypothetical protein
VSIKIFNLEKQDIYPVVFAKFVYYIFFLFKKTIIEIETEIKLIEQNKKRKKHHARLHILEILTENKVHSYKRYKKNYR